MGCKNSKSQQKLVIAEDDDDEAWRFAHASNNTSHDNLVQVHRSAYGRKNSSSVSNNHKGGNQDKYMDQVKVRDVFDDYEVVKNLGTGSLGSVDLVLRKETKRGVMSSLHGSLSDGDTSGNEKQNPAVQSPGRNGVGRPYALKSIITTAMSKSATKELHNEIVLLRTLDHPNIVRLYSVYESQDNIYLVMQCCEGGDLWSMVPYSEAEAARITSSICSAISYMHSRHITHRDLKFENIIFEKRGQGSVVKLIDFGLGRKYAPDARFMFDICGTLYTMSPQVLRGTYTNEADCWAIGVISYMMLSNRKPFFHSEKEVTIRKIMTADFNFEGKGWENISDSAKKFVSELLVTDPFNRLSAAKACKHEWLKNSESANSATIPVDEYMDILKENMQAYAGACELKKLALTIVAHKSTSEELLELHNAFKQFDTEHDGVIRKFEFVQMMKRFHYSDEEIESMFTSMDLFNDGHIQYVEFIAATLETCGILEENRLREAFSRLDVDDSGFITKENLRDILGRDYTEERAEQLIQQVDTSSSGHISFEDFLRQFQSGQAKLMQHLSSRTIMSEESVMELARNEFEKVSSLRGTISHRDNLSDRHINRSPKISIQTKSLRI